MKGSLPNCYFKVGRKLALYVVAGFPLIGTKGPIKYSPRPKAHLSTTILHLTFSSFSFLLSYLIFLFEAVSFSRLHLVDVLEEVSHPHGRVELTRVVRRALPAAVAVGRASQ